MLFAKTDRELLIIGSLPIIYYIFDYATTKFFQSVVFRQ